MCIKFIVVIWCQFSILYLYVFVSVNVCVSLISQSSLSVSLFSERLSARQECAADRERDPWPVPQVPGNLPQSANPAGAGGATQDLRWVPLASHILPRAVHRFFFLSFSFLCVWIMWTQQYIFPSWGHRTRHWLIRLSANVMTIVAVTAAVLYYRPLLVLMQALSRGTPMKVPSVLISVE